jgi:hypothetical protein
VKTTAGLKPVPVQIQKDLIDNRSTMTQIDQAIASLDANPGAMGLKNILGDEINQRIDPGGIDVRAAISNIGSRIIHDRSGAAVTIAETPRLKPFIPMPTDTASTARKKLLALRQEAMNRTSEIEGMYGEDSGYRQMGGQSSPAPAQPSRPAPVRPPAKASAAQAGRRLSPQEAAKLKPGTRFIGQDGVERIRK